MVSREKEQSHCIDKATAVVRGDFNCAQTAVCLCFAATCSEGKQGVHHIVGLCKESFMACVISY